MSRRLSYSEITTALQCPAKWDFSYGGRLAGDALKSRHVIPILRDGRAWGAGVAAYHQSHGLLSLLDGADAIRASIDEDLEHMREADVMTEETLDQYGSGLLRLEQLLAHYDSLSDPLPGLTRLEDEIVVPIPSRNSARGSTRYQYGAKIDGFTVDNDAEWLVEFKLHGRLQQRWLIELLPQLRWYGWARQKESNRPVIGVIFDERLNELPRPPKILKDGSVSNDQRQMCTVTDYVKACHERGQDPDPEMVMVLGQRVWQQRTYVLFRPGELEEAGKELTSAGITIRDLDAGVTFPTRNASVMNCNGCRFKSICREPHGQLVDERFLRTEPKRLRGEQVPA